MTQNKLQTIHPGKILLEEFLKPHHMSLCQLSLDINLKSQKVRQIVGGVQSITPDIADRLAKIFGTTAKFWLNLQTKYQHETP